MNDESIKKILVEKETYKGLSTVQANEKLKIFGFNKRPATKQKTWIQRIFGIFTEPMMILLLAPSSIYFLLGDKVEAIILLCTIIPVGIIEFIQEQKTNEAIKELDKLLVEYCQAYRDGEIKKLETKYLVPEDLVYLASGDKIPADGILFRSPGLMIDESSLTGESISVTKSEITSPNDANHENKLFQGTLVTQGEGYMLITETGVNTAYGKLGSLLANIITKETPLQTKIHRLVKGVAIIAVIAAVLISIINALRLGIVHGILSGLTIAMAIIPEEFPVVFSVFLIMGVWRMTKQKTLIREMAMVETLGSATVICTDKTGTLTEGKMEIKEIYCHDKHFDMSDVKSHKVDFTKLITTTLLALEQVATDPIETEVQNFARKINIDFEKLYKEHILVDDAPFESKSKMVHHLWANQKGDKIQYSAGAPEFIIKQSALSDKQTKDAMNAYEKMASQGYRVIGVAKKETDDSKILVSDLEFVGLLAMSDPPRAGVKEAIEICQKAGIRVIMITGDNKLTAHSVAEQIGLKHNEDIVVGSEMENVSMDAIKNIVKKHDIFTRVKPEQKYQIVEALQNLGETVAMTGDGVNDAPALKKADIGIAMGKKGTDVARAAAGIVLMEDNFASIVNSIKEGRRIYDNLRQAFLFLFSFHIPIIGLALLPLFFGHPLIFAPIHIIFLELICDPAAVLGFEREKARKNLMAEKPKPKNEPLVNKKMIGKILIYGLSILGVSFGLYWHYAITLGNEEMGRTASLLSLIISQIILIIATREWPQVKSNGLLLSITILTLLSIVAIIKIGVVRELFYLSPLDFKHSIAMFAIPALVMSAIAISSKILHLNKN